MDRSPGLVQAIVPGSLVAIDTMAFIYRVETSPNYAPIVEPFFTALARGSFRAVTSVITLMEITVGPLRAERPDLADGYELLLAAFPSLVLVDVDRTIGRRAAELRAAHRIRPVDAIQLATGLVSGARYFVTNDRALARIPGIEILLLDSYLEHPSG